MSKNSKKINENSDDSTTSNAVELSSASNSNQNSLKAKTHASQLKEPKLSKLQFKLKRDKPAKLSWQRRLAFICGVLAVVLLAVSALLSQYFRNRSLPGVKMAGEAVGSLTRQQIKNRLINKEKNIAIVFRSGDKILTPKLEDIGYGVDIDETVDNVINAKRNNGIFKKIAIWSKKNIAVTVNVNDSLLNQYIETNLPQLTKAPVDSQLSFDEDQGKFVITSQQYGSGPDMKALKQQLYESGSKLGAHEIKVSVSEQEPKITEKKLQPLINPANSIIAHKVTLEGGGKFYQASPSEIASWLTPTPQANGVIKLVVDSAKIQSYVDAIGKKISSPPVDKKVLKDDQTGQETTFQEGRDGTELADRSTLASNIAQSLKDNQDSTQTMNIKISPFQAVSMSTFDKWLEIDIGAQRVTAYERTVPVRNFIVSTGLPGHATVTGEFALWHKNRSQTMRGGSKADGSYYSIPNVEWVSYFYQDYAFHGAWWRKQFGVPGSHGCVNMTNEDARWVYEWAPMGTKVFSHN